MIHDDVQCPSTLPELNDLAESLTDVHEKMKATTHWEIVRTVVILEGQRLSRSVCQHVCCQLGCLILDCQREFESL